MLPNPLHKSEGFTAIISLLCGLIWIQGTGHFYVGRIKRGIVFLVAALTLGITGYTMLANMVGIPILIGAYVLCILQMLDAWKLCKRYNEHITKHGTPPW